MPMVTWEYDGAVYCAMSTEVVTGEGPITAHELSEARLIPPASAAATASPAPGPAAVTVVAYDPEEEKPPMVSFDAGEAVPFAVLRHFVALVAATVEGS
ncbi:hypothetical protein [Micromonospora sp. NPDC048830]|uniref:hypothetical protein n=1 Tax=Micromonospora sp. NPDC048830 TaxID=3364257 RepID=UPI00371C4994